MTAPDGYSPRHACALPKLTIRMMIVNPGRVETCASVPSCGRVWTSVWGRDPGGESQPQWIIYPQVGDLLARTLTFHRSLPLVAAIALGGTLDVTCPWPAPFPDTNYTVEPLPTGLLVGRVKLTVKSQSPASAVVTVAPLAGLTVAAGSVLDVTATRYA